MMSTNDGADNRHDGANREPIEPIGDAKSASEAEKTEKSWFRRLNEVLHKRHQIIDIYIKSIALILTIGTLVVLVNQVAHMAKQTHVIAKQNEAIWYSNRPDLYVMPTDNSKASVVSLTLLYSDRFFGGSYLRFWFSERRSVSGYGL